MTATDIPKYCCWARGREVAGPGINPPEVRLHNAALHPWSPQSLTPALTKTQRGAQLLGHPALLFKSRDKAVRYTCKIVK